MEIYGNFNGYIRQISDSGTSSGIHGPTFILPSGPKCPILGPKIGPKWPKSLFYCYITYMRVQGVIFTYFTALSMSVVFIFIHFP